MGDVRGSAIVIVVGMLLAACGGDDELHLVDLLARHVVPEEPCTNPHRRNECGRLCPAADGGAGSRRGPRTRRCDSPGDQRRRGDDRQPTCTLSWARPIPPDIDAVVAHGEVVVERGGGQAFTRGSVKSIDGRLLALMTARFPMLPLAASAGGYVCSDDSCSHRTRVYQFSPPSALGRPRRNPRAPTRRPRRTDHDPSPHGGPPSRPERDEV